MKHIETNTPKRRKGVTLIEALFVLGIAAVLLGLVMVLLSQTTSSNKTNQLSQEITTIVDATHELYQGQPTYGTDAIGTTLAQSGLIPSRYIGTGNVLVSPFGATITVTGNASANLNTFQIAVPNVPQASCVKLATTDYGNGLASRTPAGGANGAPLTASQAVAACPAAGVEMDFTFQ